MIFFILRVFAIYVFWKLLLWFLGEESVPLRKRHWRWLSTGWEHLNDWIRMFYLHSLKFIFNILGYPNAIISKHTILVLDTAWIGIGNYCLGIQLMIFIVALICSYPGRWKRKLLYSILGIVFFIILNILRFVALVFVIHAYPKQINFNHDFVFNVIVYILVFLFWIMMIKRGQEKVKI